jgi:hypothetical protein
LGYDRDAVALPVRRVANLDGEPQRTALREILAGLQVTREVPDTVFYYEARLRDPLRALISDPKVGESAVRLLALIGVSEDLELIVQLPPPAREGLPQNRWAYYVACALLEPSSEEEWAFLRKAALNEFNDGWVDAGAIQTLRLIASPRSQQILDEAHNGNLRRTKSIARALDYIHIQSAAARGRGFGGAGQTRRWNDRVRELGEKRNAPLQSGEGQGARRTVMK